MSNENVNLVPQEVRVEKRKIGLKKFFTLASLLTLLLSVAVIVSLVVINLAQKAAINSARGKIINEQKVIASQIGTVQMVKELETRYQVLKELYAKKQRYSRLIKLLPTILPQGSQIEQFALNGKQIQVSMNTNGVVDVAKFLKVVIDPAKGGVLFSQVELKSVAIDTRTGRCNFSITLTLKDQVLTQP